LTDSATLSGGFNPTGSITFTLFRNGTLVDTETVTVNHGNGTYTTPTGFTLPTSGVVTGTYQWDASYSGDPNNKAASDDDAADERVTVSAASPTLTTSPSPIAVTLGGTAPPLLTDSATLSGGYHPSGSITFTLFHNGGTTPLDTEMVPVSGNGIYTTPTGFTLPAAGTVTGTYQWEASYSGDGSNTTTSDTNASNERVTVSPASPTLTTTPSPTSVTLGGRLQDVAHLAGGYKVTGTITFRLYAPGVDPSVGPATYTEVVTGVNSDGIYQTAVGFAPNATGIWHWVATYNCSYARLWGAVQESAGKRVGAGNRKAGNAWLKWAFSEAAVLSAQKDERIGGLLQRLAAKLGKPKALSALAHKLGRAFYHLLHTKEVFDVNRFVRP
jgi:hypothetical protein